MSDDFALPDFRTTLQRYDDARPRTVQITLGPSDVDTCLRQSAYRHHGTPPTDYRSKAAARLGTLLHLGWSQMIAEMAQPGVHADQEIVIPGLLAPGHADEIDENTLTVTDLKTMSDRVWDSLSTFGPRESQWDQVELYGYGLWRDGGEEEQWTLRLILLNRGNGEQATFERPADPVRGKALAQRMQRRQNAIDTSTSPEEIEREGDGPGRGFPCDWCEFTTACWGPERTDNLSPQAALIIDNPFEIQLKAQEYLDASVEEKAAKARKDTARAYLTGIPTGEYGDVRVAWRGGKPGQPKPDLEAITAVYDEAGLEIPTKVSTTALSIRVTRVAIE